MNINIRKAGSADCEDIFVWRNDEKTVESSFNSAIIPYEEHLLWYRKTLEDDDRIIFIGEDPAGEKFGMIRFDKVNTDTYEVSVNLAPEYRGRGLGAELITQASGLVKGRLLAKIKAGNPASVRAFKKSGYVGAGEKDNTICMEYISR